MVLNVGLLIALTAGPAPPQSLQPGTEPDLQTGIKQVNDGDLAGGVLTLEAIIRRLALEPAQYPKELSQAYLYRGVAFVGLGQEENAKGSFAAALQYDKELRIGEDKFPPRVVRVFEAARLRKTKSVLLPPTNVAKKTGIGALGVAGVIAGVAVVGGGVAAAAGGSTPPPTPTPAPSPTPTPITGGFVSGAVRIGYVAAAPPPGSTISTTLGQISSALQIALTFTSPNVPRTGRTFLRLYPDNAHPNCQIGLDHSLTEPLTLPADTPITVTFGGASIFYGFQSCLSPGDNSFTTVQIDARFIGDVQSQTVFDITYTWHIKE